MSGGFNPHPARRQGATRLACNPPLRLSQFQSPPCPKTGCDPVPRAAHPACPCFNPHPARRQGATPVPSSASARRLPFQSPPCPKTGCDADPLHGVPDRDRFQSPPCPKTGCDLPTHGCLTRRSGFNPHPARRQGATNYDACMELAPGVSIPTLPEDRVRQRSLPLGIRTCCVFQSPPCPKTGCDSVAGSPCSPEPRFNPHPARRQGATSSVAALPL